MPIVLSRSNIAATTTVRLNFPTEAGGPQYFPIPFPTHLVGVTVAGIEPQHDFAESEQVVGTGASGLEVQSIHAASSFVVLRLGIKLDRQTGP